MSRSNKIGRRLTWESLSHSAQFRLATRVIARRKREWLRKYPGLVTVGFGVKHRGKQRSQNEPLCLVFFVAKKKSTKKAQRIPRCIRSRIKKGRRWVVVNIPTDVLQRGRGHLQANPFAACDDGGPTFRRGSSDGSGGLRSACRHSRGSPARSLRRAAPRNGRPGDR